MPVLGMRTTYDLVAEERPKAWRIGIIDAEPDIAPFTALTWRVGKQKKVVEDPEFAWWEREYDIREVTVNAGDVPGALAAGSADTLRVDTPGASYCVSGQLAMNMRTEELILVTADPADLINLVIRRGVGGSGVQAAWNAGDTVMIMGTAHKQGDPVPKAQAYEPFKRRNYTEIFRNSTDNTRTALKTKLRTKDLRKRAQAECMKLHLEDIERGFLFHRPEEIASANSVRTITGGLLYWCDGGLEYDFTGSLTRALWRDLQYEVNSEGADEKILLAGSTLIQVLEEMAEDLSLQMRDVPKTDTYGMSMRKWVQSLGGTLYVQEHKMFSKSSVLHDWGVIVDPDSLTYRYIDDTEWYPNRQDNGDDRNIGEYLTECGLEIERPKTRFAVIRNCSVYKP